MSGKFKDWKNRKVAASLRETEPRQIGPSELRQVEVLSALVDRRRAQDAKFGKDSDNYDFHPALMSDERNTESYIPSAGELRLRLARAVKEGKCNWFDILLEEVCEVAETKTPEELEDELLDVAATAVAWIEALRRRRGQ